MALIVPHAVRRAFLAETTTITRRVEIYEQDSETPFEPELWPSILVDGSVAMDNSDDERRTLDVTLANPGSRLDPTIDKLWYDKVIKVFYGVELPRSARTPRVAVVADDSLGECTKAIATLTGTAAAIDYLPVTATLDEVADFDIVAFIGLTTLRKTELLSETVAHGMTVVVFSPVATQAEAPMFISTAANSTATLTSDVMRPMAPEEAQWEAFSLTSRPARAILTPAPGTNIAALDSSGPGILTMQSGITGARAALVHMADFRAAAFTEEADQQSAALMLRSLFSWLGGEVTRTDWEMQVGEFLIDSASADSEALGQVSVTGRDRVKACQLSKLEQAITFEKGEPIEYAIDQLAANAWVKKRNLPVTGSVLDRDYTYEPDTARWEIMREMATAFNYDLHFDNTGFLVMSQFQDPLSATPSLDLSVGKYGNLVSRGLKTSDSELFNHVVVVGEGSDSDAPPVWASAINENPSSPSNVYELGDRVLRHTSSVITSIAQAQEVADAMLKVASLEEFELDFATPPLPWVEPGQIVYLTDEAAGTWGPNRFLISSLELPLDMSEMSGNGKRVINVGQL